MTNKGFAIFCLLFIHASTGQAAEFEFHGDFNNRFQLYTNQNNFFNNNQPDAMLGDLTGKASIDDSYGELKYRLWTTATTNGGKAKAVYAVEIGGVRFGRSGTGRSQGGSFSGDGANVETRWAYVDLKLPEHTDHAVKIGLQPYKLNRFVWNETATGVLFAGKLSQGTSYETGWVRGRELRNSTSEDDFQAMDALSVRFAQSLSKETSVGGFLLYQIGDGDASGIDNFGAINSANYEVKQFGQIDIDIFSVGVEGDFKKKFGAADGFLEWDVIFQTGDIGNAIYTSDAIGAGRSDVVSNQTHLDLESWFVNLKFGLNIGDTKLSYTFWYASGDDNPNDGDSDAFLATDVDMTESIIFFEGGYTDDQSHSERPYLLDKGLIMNRLGADYKAATNLTVGGAALYMLTSEDVVYHDDDDRSRSEAE
ncbi:MAG: hypothetical protein MI864_03870, partial [Pseudomonadales bacterium]|nr:hypothetical protein [Pseudomonadales bacterium]